MIAMQLGGSASSAIGAYGTARTNQIALQSQADISSINAGVSQTVANYNSGVAERQAQTALTQGAREEQRSRLATAQLKSRQRAAMAANGIDLGEGSAANVLTTTDVMGEIDADTLRSNAIMAAWGYRAQGANARIQGAIQSGNYQVDAAQRRGAAKGISPVGSMASSLLTSAGSVGNSWYRINSGTSG